MADGRQLEIAKSVVIMDIINSLLKTGNKTACKSQTGRTALLSADLAPAAKNVQNRRYYWQLNKQNNNVSSFWGFRPQIP